LLRPAVRRLSPKRRRGAELDVTSDEDAVGSARAARNVNLLVNNAGIARSGGFLADGAVEAA
jgi:NADP-dependent 3-hydroxy acid dehydrogenase YdfG